MFFPESAVVIDATSPTGAAGEPCAPSLGAYAVAALCDRGAPAQRIDLARLPRAALFDGYASDRLAAAERALREAEFAVVVADARAPEGLGWVRAFAARMGAEALRRRPILIVLATDRLAQADALARSFRAAVIAAGARDVDIAVLDLARDGYELDLESLLAARLAEAISPAEAALVELQAAPVGAGRQGPRVSAAA